MPSVSRVAILWNAEDLATTLRYREIDEAARALRISVQPLGVREPDDFDQAFAAMDRDRPDALFMVTDSLTSLNRKHVLDSRRHIVSRRCMNTRRWSAKGD